MLVRLLVCDSPVLVPVVRPSNRKELEMMVRPTAPNHVNGCVDLVGCIDLERPDIGTVVEQGHLPVLWAERAFEINVSEFLAVHREEVRHDARRDIAKSVHSQKQRLKRR